MNPAILHSLSIILVFFGTGFMIISIFTSLKINRVVITEIKSKWVLITSLMISFLFGYSAFLFLQFKNIENYFELIGAIIFLGGAVFVLLVMLIIQNTLTIMNRTSRELADKVIEHKDVSVELNQSRATLESIFNNAIPLCITDKDYQIIRANEAYYTIFGDSPQEPARKNCFDSRPGKSCHTEECPLARIMQGDNEVICDTVKQNDSGRERTFIVTARPFLDADKNTIGIVESFQDISDRKLAEDAKAELIEELQAALEEVNLLSGFLPICASCKKIRDDKGYWNQIESYIRTHSGVEFSHGICPDCAKQLYPDYYKKISQKKQS
jgi:PAS domain S-box-containing protein